MGQQEQLQKHMSAVVDYRQRLAALQGGWDSLALLTHFGDGGADLGNTRQAFDSLAAELVTHLSNETYKKAAQAAEACVSAGAPDQAVMLLLEIEQPVYEATTLLNAASLVHRMQRE